LFNNFVKRKVTADGWLFPKDFLNKFTASRNGSSIKLTISTLPDKKNNSSSTGKIIQQKTTNVCALKGKTLSKKNASPARKHRGRK
jgi:hypothetical protein